MFILVIPSELSDENQDGEKDEKINIDKIKKILEATDAKWINDLKCRKFNYNLSC